MSKLDSIISDFANQIASQARQSLLAELRTMSMDQVFALAGGEAKAAAAAPAKAAKAAKGASAAAPAPVAAAAPVKRGPGRPRKDAAVAAPKAAAKPVKVAKAPKAAAKPAKVAMAPKAAAAPKKAKKSASGRLARRSVGDIQSTLTQIVAFVQANPGVRSEHITASLGLDKKELPRPIAEGLASGALTKEGQKRATQYFAGGKKRR